MTKRNSVASSSYEHISNGGISVSHVIQAQDDSKAKLHLLSVQVSNMGVGAETTIPVVSRMHALDIAEIMLHIARSMTAEDEKLFAYLRQ